MVKFPDPIFIHKFDVDNASGTFLSAEDVQGEEAKYRKFISQDELDFALKLQKARIYRLFLYGEFRHEQKMQMNLDLFELDKEIQAHNQT